MSFLIHLQIFLHRQQLQNILEQQQQKSFFLIKVFHNFHRLLKNFYGLELLLSWITPTWLTDMNKMPSVICRQATKSTLEKWVESSDTRIISGDQELVQKSSPLRLQKPAENNSKRMITTKKRARILHLQRKRMATRGKQLPISSTTLPLHP